MQQYWNLELLRCNHSNGVTTEVGTASCLAVNPLYNREEKPEMFQVSPSTKEKFHSREAQKNEV